MSFCNWFRAYRYPPAAPRPAPPAPEPAPWIPGPLKGKVLDVYLCPPELWATMDQEYGAEGMAWAWGNNNEVVLKQQYWPRILRPDAHGATGFLDAQRAIRRFSNSYQEGIFIHESGHFLHNVTHGDPHPSMNLPENLPAEQRMALLLEVVAAYPTWRVLPWQPGMMIDADDLPVAE